MGEIIFPAQFQQTATKAPEIVRRTILSLRSGPARRAHVIEETQVGYSRRYWIQVENIFVTGSSTITGPVLGQHEAIALARAAIS